jgi:hypothetical protein
MNNNDDIIIEQVNDASSIQIDDDYLFDDAEDEIKEDTEFTDDSSSICSLSSNEESETLTPEIQNNFLSDKSMQAFITTNHLESNSSR